jgi:hypothetical protein
MEVPIVINEDFLSGWQKVQIEKYLLADQEPGLESNLDALMGKIRDYFQSSKSITVHVQTVEGNNTQKVFLSWQDLWYVAKKALWGKGSPEEVQVTLQLAVRFGLVKPEKLQNDYCDKVNGKVGLDCNGFVGNYVWHGAWGAPWDSDKTGADWEANKGIRTIVGGAGPQIKTVKEISPVGTYLGALVGGDRQIIDRYGGGGIIGHLVVTQPGTLTTGYMQGKLCPVLRAYESTGRVGLTDSDYYILNVATDGVFTVYRTSKKETKDFRISRLACV